MVIFPEVMGEIELSYFTEADLSALEMVLDDTLATYLLQYMQNPESNPDVVARVQESVGRAVESLTLPAILRDKGILDLLVGLSPEGLFQQDTAMIKDQLTFLERNIDKAREFVQPRTKAVYDNFVDSLLGAEARLRMDGLTPTFTDLKQRIISNRFMFYVPNDKGHKTGIDIIHRRRKIWTICLRGIEYMEYCNTNGIDMSIRSNF